MYKVILGLFAFLPALLQAGMPYFVNVAKNEYKAAGQNTAICITPDQRYVYAGNLQGLLEFNGSSWQTYTLPSSAPVYSVYAAQDNRVYIGSFEEIGYFERNQYGRLDYTSLNSSIKNYAFNNDDIHKIVEWRDKIYFLSLSTLFVYDKEEKVTQAQPLQFSFMTELDNTLYAFQDEVGLGILQHNDSFELLIPAAKLNNNKVVDIMPYQPGRILVITSGSGIYLLEGEKYDVWKSEINEQLHDKTVNSTINLPHDSTYVMGTNGNGIIAFDRLGKIKWEITKSQDLLNNTIHDLCCDNDDNIWVATDNGIAYIEDDSAIRFIKPFKNDIGTVYSSVFHNGYLYLATNQGVFYSKNNGKDFVAQPVPGLSGIANELKIYDNQLICCHLNGTFLIEGEKAISISDIKDAKIMKKAIIHQQELLIQSASHFLNIYKKDWNGNWKFSHSIQDFLYPIRQIEIDAHGNIWVLHQYKGLFRIKLNYDLDRTERVEHYNLNNSTNVNKINLFKLKGYVVFGNNSTYYTHDEISNTIIPYQPLINELEEINDIKDAIAIDNDNYWCTSSKGFLKIHFTENLLELDQFIPFSYFNHEFPDYNQKIVYSNNFIIFCLNNGIAFLDKNKENKLNENDCSLRITSIENFSNSNSESSFLKLQNTRREVVEHNSNNLLFNVACNDFLKGVVQFKFKLNGLETEFSEPSSEPYREYNRLHAGKYTLHVVACDYIGNELSTVSYEFEIKQSYYASKGAFILYFLCVCLLGFTLLYFIRKHIKKSNLKISLEQEKLRKEERELKEKEIIELKNKNLESELYYKSKELASSTFLLINKTNILQDIKNELNDQKEKLGTQYPTKYYNKLIGLINSGLQTEDNWRIFQTNFDRIHENFFRNLKSAYPDLTPTDLKFCALLRLNLSTKDMANFSGNTIRGIDSARYRLRKKFNLPSEQDLVEFLIQFKGSENDIHIEK